MEHFQNSLPGEKPQMGSVQKAGVFVAKIANAQFGLQGPVLHIGNASGNARVFRHDAANLAQDLPGVPEVLERVTEDPAVPVCIFLPESIACGFDVKDLALVTVALCKFCVGWIYLNAKVVAVWR
jgi:hypothetical protein